MLKNNFYNQVKAAGDYNVSVEEFIQSLGRLIDKKGLFKVNMNDSELQIGQVSTLIKLIPPY